MALGAPAAADITSMAGGLVQQAQATMRERAIVSGIESHLSPGAMGRLEPLIAALVSALGSTSIVPNPALAAVRGVGSAFPGASPAQSRDLAAVVLMEGLRRSAPVAPTTLGGLPSGLGGQLGGLTGAAVGLTGSAGQTQPLAGHVDRRSQIVDALGNLLKGTNASTGSIVQNLK